MKHKDKFIEIRVLIARVDCFLSQNMLVQAHAKCRAIESKVRDILYSNDVDVGNMIKYTSLIISYILNGKTNEAKENITNLLQELLNITKEK